MQQVIGDLVAKVKDTTFPLLILSLGGCGGVWLSIHLYLCFFFPSSVVKAGACLQRRNSIGQPSVVPCIFEHRNRREG